MRRHRRPEEFVTDKLMFYGAALKEIGAVDRQETGHGLNIRAKNSNLPFRRREPAMLRFRRMRTLQKSTSVYSLAQNHFPTERYLQDRNAYKRNRAAALAERGAAFSLPYPKTGWGNGDCGSPSSGSTLASTTGWAKGVRRPLHCIFRGAHPRPRARGRGQRVGRSRRRQECAPGHDLRA